MSLASELAFKDMISGLIMHYNGGDEILKPLLGEGVVNFLAGPFVRDCVLDAMQHSYEVFTKCIVTSRSVDEVEALFPNFDRDPFHPNEFVNTTREADMLIRIQCVKPMGFYDYCKQAFLTIDTLLALPPGEGKSMILDPLNIRDDLTLPELKVLGDIDEHFQKDPSKVFYLILMSVQLRKKIPEVYHLSLIENAPRVSKLPLHQFLEQFRRLFCRGFAQAMMQTLLEFKEVSGLFDAFANHYITQLKQKETLLGYVFSVFAYWDSLPRQERAKITSFDVLSLFLLQEVLVLKKGIHKLDAAIHHVVESFANRYPGEHGEWNDEMKETLKMMLKSDLKAYKAFKHPKLPAGWLPYYQGAYLHTQPAEQASEEVLQKTIENPKPN